MKVGLSREDAFLSINKMYFGVTQVAIKLTTPSCQECCRAYDIAPSLSMIVLLSMRCGCQLDAVYLSRVAVCSM